MKCPFCGNTEDKVIDSRMSAEGQNTRRRRECLKCGRRFTTYEYVEETPLMVIKRDGNRQRFDRERVKAGIIKACEKRPVSMDQIDTAVDEVERKVQRETDREIKSTRIGDLVMEKLYDLDEVAYVRFASVYRRFKDVSHFMKELEKFLG
ncbi:MAG: transcriptional regulator NrdR [Candidatus Omnitrophica bacterium]|nr:transcriptional regulator NrdR [Candidatus Omnitrophota bacterium]MBU1128947.1 transcriptional regulator NrdR [Candidatus Omnitrophota bacterium]MBU1657154.1 transcriptional regulator NrdR [Candidatus Omnitrophota bacterium]MBU1784108.1 transcriptional regulator NrdR [Candidatus Omnitrophota bacterium]MBU1850838.1 transcriptional regulator NrdR [Candidatus Omnitrophota bacterium]